MGFAIAVTELSAPAPPDSSAYSWQSRWESDSVRKETTVQTRSSGAFLRSNVVNTLYRVTRDSHGLPLREAAGEGSGLLAWGDTTQWIHDEAGRVLYQRRSYQRFPMLESALFDGSMHELSYLQFNRNDSILPRPVQLDSAQWRDGHKVRELNFQCPSTRSQEGCVLVARTEYAQLLQALPTTVRRRSDMPLRVQRSGPVVRWNSPVSDGTRATLRTLDGRILAIAIFRDGAAVAPLASSQPAVWTLDADGQTLASGRLAPPR